LWDKYVYGLIIFLLFCLLGGSIFITFIYTPYIFSHYSTKEAGEIVSKIFPFYFKFGWIIGIIIYTLIGALSLKEKEIIKKLKWFIIATAVLILISMALDRAILPITEGLKSEYYDLLNEGTLEIKVEKTGDELEELAEAFERMRISLKTIMEKLEKGEL